MSASELEFYLLEQWQHTSTLEIIAVAFGVAQVLLAYKNTVWLYPAGLVATGIYTWIFMQPHIGLYAEAALNLYYFIMSIYGWGLWVKGKNNGTPGLAVTRASRRDGWITLGILLAGWAILNAVLRGFTDSTTPLTDAFVSAAAWAGMWLLAKKKLENWLVLNLSNIVAIPLLFYKKLPLTACLTIFLFVVAVLGYFRWRKQMRAEAAVKRQTGAGAYEVDPLRHTGSRS